MKHKILTAILLAFATYVSAAPGSTNSVYSQTTISNMFYTNRIALELATSNVNYLTTNNFITLSNNSVAVSNMFFAYTNGTISSNILVIVPGSLTNSINITNGTLRSVTPVP